MKIALLSIFSFACTTLAMPVPPSIPTQIQKLEVTILDVIRDLSQGQNDLKKDYMSGMDQYTTLIDELSGPKTCSSLSSFEPKSEDHAITALRKSREHLLQLVTNPRIDLKRDLSQSIMDSTDPNVCSAYARYYAVRPYIRSL